MDYPINVLNIIFNYLPPVSGVLRRQSPGGAPDHGGRRVGQVGVRRRVHPRATRRPHHMFCELYF